MENQERLFTPKEILERVSEFEIASLRHLNTRREMGIISSSKASERRGQKNLYDLKTALIYCILTELENNKFDIKDAEYFAKILISREFPFRNNIWLVILYGNYNKELKQSYLGFYKNSYRSIEQIESEKTKLEKKEKTKFEDNIIINPLPDIFFKFFMSEYKEYQTLLKTIKGIKTMEMGDILQKYLDKFQVSDNEITILSRNAITNYESPDLN